VTANGTGPHGPDHCVRVRGARENNQRGVDLGLPRNPQAVVTGVSGSGK
jgi:excinuclease ABC subunit A